MGKDDPFDDRLKQGEIVEEKFFNSHKSILGLIWNKGETQQYYPMPLEFSDRYGENDYYKAPDFYTMKHKVYLEMKTHLFQVIKKRDIEAYYHMFETSRDGVYLIVPSYSGLENTYEVCDVQYLYENLIPNVEWKKKEDYDWHCEITPEIRECFKPFDEVFDF